MAKLTAAARKKIPAKKFGIEVSKDDKKRHLASIQPDEVDRAEMQRILDVVSLEMSFTA